MRRAAKVDSNHVAVVDAFRALGCSVVSLAAIGKGCPDLAIGVAGKNLLIEVKDGAKSASRRKLTPDQEQFKADWRGCILYVNSAAEVPTIVSAMRKFYGPDK
jgi:Holliday junction resolvase